MGEPQQAEPAMLLVGSLYREENRLQAAGCTLRASLRLEYKEALRALRADADTRCLTLGDLTPE
jgi:hypothetical protein